MVLILLLHFSFSTAFSRYHISILHSDTYTVMYTHMSTNEFPPAHCWKIHEYIKTRTCWLTHRSESNISEMIQVLLFSSSSTHKRVFEWLSVYRLPWISSCGMNVRWIYENIKKHCSCPPTHICRTSYPTHHPPNTHTHTHKHNMVS